MWAGFDSGWHAGRPAGLLVAAQGETVAPINGRNAPSLSDAALTACSALMFPSRLRRYSGRPLCCDSGLQVPA